MDKDEAARLIEANPDFLAREGALESGSDLYGDERDVPVLKVPATKR
ncbi:MAG: hypothetical protein M0D54_10900 [Hyphomonadaceae bacterium JAD_PAG50586_4]|nr:MAG: hypothetical protein M0D54_10900 [Hyphomonadaceae bacterium JAD_PAG50586_4]